MDEGRVTAGKVLRFLLPDQVATLKAAHAATDEAMERNGITPESAGPAFHRQRALELEAIARAEAMLSREP